MRHDPTSPAPPSRPDVPRAPRATGTIPRGDPRRKHSPPSPRGTWTFGLLGLVVGVFLIGWTLSGGSAAPGNTATATPTPHPSQATATQLSTPAPSPRLDPTTAQTIGPTAPTPTPELTPIPTQQSGLVVDFPHDGEVVSVPDINVIGSAATGSTVTRDISLWFDDHTLTRADGVWMLPVHLGDGENVLRFRIDGDRSTEQVITVLYQP